VILQKRILSRLLGPARLLGASDARERHKPLRQVTLGSELEFLFTTSTLQPFLHKQPAKFARAHDTRPRSSSFTLSLMDVG
jgi:hypothetical protein